MKDEHTIKVSNEVLAYLEDTEGLRSCSYCKKYIFRMDATNAQGNKLWCSDECYAMETMYPNPEEAIP